MRSIFRLVLGQAIMTFPVLIDYHLGYLDRLGHYVRRVILLPELAAHSLSALGAPVLHLGEYLALPLEHLGLHELAGDSLKVKGIISERGRLHLS
jgi:hypothetical protein